MEEPETIINNEPEVAEQETTQEVAQETSIPADVISFKHVNIAHRKLRVLTDISFSIRQGEFVYLIGKTGSGKQDQASPPFSKPSSANSSRKVRKP